MREPISMGIRKVTLKVQSAISVTAPLVLSLLVTSANAEPLQIFGYSGDLGEWELTAAVTPEGLFADNQYSGILLMKHVGLCTQDGPEEKSGKIRIRMPPSASQLEATIWVDGTECSYRGVLTDFYIGRLNCTGREMVPLKLWLTKQ
jgi:hypothetical protein